jgi:hypothetical protein
MTVPIIAFMVSSRLRELRSKIILPIGFYSAGNSTNNPDCQCQLILLDDWYYAEKEVRSPKNSVARLMQHNANSDQWELQKDQLENWGWKSPVRVEGFSHVTGNTFWDFIFRLVQTSTMGGLASVLDEIYQHYNSLHTLNLLEKWAAYKILIELSPNQDETIVQKKSAAYDQLPKEIKKALDPELPEDQRLKLSECIDIANVEAIKLLAV